MASQSLDVNTKTLVVTINGPETPDEKAQWDKMHDRRAAALEEAAALKQRLKRKSRYSHFYEEDMKREQRMADMIGAVLPDEAKRTTPGFQHEAVARTPGGVEQDQARPEQGWGAALGALRVIFAPQADIQTHLESGRLSGVPSACHLHS